MPLLTLTSSNTNGSRFASYKYDSYATFFTVNDVVSSSRTGFMQVIYPDHRVVQSVFRSVRLEHETHAKYETYSCLNTDAYVFKVF